MQGEYSNEVKTGKDHRNQISHLEKELSAKAEELLKITALLEDSRTERLPDTEVVNSKVKEILNIFFRRFRSGIVTTDQYNGDHVLSLAINTIKCVTRKMLSSSDDLSDGSTSEGSTSKEEEDGSDGDEDSDSEDDDDDDDEAGGAGVESHDVVQTSDSTEFQVQNTPTDILAHPVVPENEPPGPSGLSDENGCSFVVAESAPIISDDSNTAAPADSEVAIVDDQGTSQKVLPPSLVLNESAPGRVPEEFTTNNDEEELFDQPVPSEPPPSPAPASFEPNVHDSLVNVEDISSLSAEVCL